MEFIAGKDLTEMWFNLLIYNTCNENVYYFHPYIVMRYLLASSKNLSFENTQLVEDFFKYSEYNKAMKLSQLRKEYYTGKVEKQYKVIKKYLLDFSPRQSRAAIYFSEPAFDKTSKLKCLESLYFQKIDKRKYEAFLVFRNTEIYPKLFMDLIYIKELLDEIDRDTGSKCVGFRGMIINAFLNLHQVVLVKLLLNKWGISNFSSHFNKMLDQFFLKYPKDKIDNISFISIKRVVNRTYKLLEET